MNIRLTALLTLLIFALSAFGQSQLVVRDFKPLPNDQTANMFGDMKKDQNGRTAALVKVRSTIQDLNFDGGITGIVAVVNKPGEYWVYVPEKSRKLFVRHAQYGVMEFDYPKRIQAAKTYSMEINVDGKEVSLETSVPRTEIILDDKPIGPSPQTVYLPYGLHSVQVRNGNMVFDGNIEVKRDDQTRILIDMVDETENWGKVRLHTNPDAALYFNDELVGVDGVWEPTLPPGTYTIEARDPFEKGDTQITTFTVEAKGNHDVPVTPPVPHVGYLNLVISPIGTTVTEGGNTLPSDGNYTFTVGRHELTFDMPGYHPQSKVYDVVHNVRENASVTLRPIEFAKSTTVYAAVGGNYNNGLGLSFLLGGIYRNIDLSLSYTIGFSSSDPVYWLENGVYDSQATYKVNSFGLRAGYQFHVNRHLGITPYTGYLGQTISPSNGDLGKGLLAGNLLIGAKVYYVPVQHFGVFLAPEYAVPVQSSDLGKDIAKMAGLTRGGFGLTLGVVFNI